MDLESIDSKRDRGYGLALEPNEPPMRGSAPTFSHCRVIVRWSHTSGRPAIPRVAGLIEAIMNKPEVQHSAQGAHAQDHTATSKHSAAVSSSSKPAVKPGAEPNAHVCTDACTHEGATKGAAPSAEKSPVKAAPTAAKTGNEAATRSR